MECARRSREQRFHSSECGRGWTQESRKEKAQFFAIAHGSLSELETLVTICEQLGWFPEAETPKLRSLMDEVSRMLTTMRRNHRAA
jgi:four helix bundle protein